MNKKTKILFVITKGMWGGAQKYVFDLATALKDTSDVIVAYGTLGELPKKVEELGIKTIHLDALGRDVNPLLDLSSFFKLFKIFKQERPEIIHLNSSKIGGLGALAGRLAGIEKIIFTAHGWAFNEDRSSFSKSIIWFLSWLTALFSTHIIVLGEKEINQALAMPFVSSKKVSLIRLGISEPEFLDQAEARKELAKKIDKPENFFENKKIVGTIAELTPNKGLEYALEAMAQASVDCIYIIIGGGELKDFLTNKISELHIQDKVFLEGFISQANRYLPAFDIFLLPSLKEGLPYVVLEAGRAELPVIATHVGATPEIIKDHESGLLIPSKDSKAIVEALTELLSHPETGFAYGKKLSQKITQEFDKKSMVEKTVTLYSAS